MKLNRYSFKNKKEFKSFYDLEASIYDKKRSSDFEGRYIDATDLKFILSNISASKNTKKIKILDCGCGTGRLLLPLAIMGFDTYAFDTSKNMLNTVKKKAKKTNIKISLKIGDIEKIPYENNSFDYVYSFKVLMHLEDWKKAFNEMYRVTKKKGRIIIDFQNYYCPWRILSILFIPATKQPKSYSYKQVTKYLKKYDFKFKGVYSYPHFFYKIPLFKRIVFLLEKYFQLPRKLRRRLMFVITK